MGEIEAESEPMVSNTGRNGGEEPHMTNKKNDHIHNHTVEIVLRTVGPARPSRLRVSSSIKVRPSFSMYMLGFGFIFVVYLHD